MFAVRPGRPGSGSGPRLVRAERGAFSGPAGFLADAGNRARVESYLADLTRPYGAELAPLSAALGHSYGEMASALLKTVVPEQEPVDLLVLAFSIHDLWPGRATASYLSHLCPGSPMSFAICDQGRAAAFSALRVARDYLALATFRRALLIVVEQAALPYDLGATAPDQHRGVAMLLGPDGESSSALPAATTGSPSSQDGPAGGAPVTAIRQHAGVPPPAVPGLVTTGLAELSAGHHDVRVVLGDALAAAWPGHPEDQVSVVPAGQPATGVWWHLIDELTPGGPDLVVAADYDPDLRYLCLAGFAPTPGSGCVPLPP